MVARTWTYGSAALLVAGAIGWEFSRRRAIADMQRSPDTQHQDGDQHITEGDVWQSVSEDVEPTLLRNPDGVFEFQQQKAALIGEPPAMRRSRPR